MFVSLVEGVRIVSRVRLARVAALLAACAALAVAGAGRAVAANPDMYVNYTPTCHFTISLDGGGSVGGGSSIPYGTYQVIVQTPFSFSNGQGSCSAINFSLSGPGVSFTTTLNDGDASEGIASASFQPNASYTATDAAVTPGTSVTFSTSGAQAAAGVAGSSTSTTSTGPAGATSALGTPIAGSKSTSFQGTLSAGVSAKGKLSLSFKGQPVATLKPGKYTLNVNDQSAKMGFVVGGPGHASTTVTTTGFKGHRSKTISLTSGQWYFSAKRGAAKTYFLVVT